MSSPARPFRAVNLISDPIHGYIELTKRLTPETFEPEPEVAVEETFRRAWDMIADQPEVEAVVRFAPNVAARVIETTWHPSQTVAREPDGSLIWRARLAGTIEVRLWILSWGADVEVLEPVALREDVVATHRRAAALYATGGGGADS